MNIFRGLRRPAATDEAGPRSEWAGEEDTPQVPRPFVAEDFEDDEFEGEGWNFWGD